jgi:hypothetical protein
MDEVESVLMAAIGRLRTTLVDLGMPPELDDGEAAAWLRARLELGWELELEGAAPRHH